MVFSALRRMRYIYGAPPTDNFVFKLCYRWTTLILVFFSFIITCRLLLGDSFVCSEDSFNHLYLNIKCYESAVYTLHAELSPSESKWTALDPSLEHFKKYHSYYQWVNLVFLAHAFNFYLPHLLWKSYERGYMYRLTAGVQKFFDREEKRGLELCYLAKYVLVTQGKHKIYTGMYVSFEACNCVVALAQTFWLLHFFDVTGLPDYMRDVLGTWSDFRNFYFPGEGFCDVQKFVSPREVLHTTALCQLPLNRLYMKMFLFLQVWYILLTVSCGLVIVYRIALAVPTFRTFAAKLSSSLSERSVLASVCRRLSYSDWFFLSRLQKAMTDIDFAQMVDKISVVSQGREDLQKDDEDVPFSLYEDVTKEFDKFATSAV